MNKERLIRVFTTLALMIILLIFFLILSMLEGCSVMSEKTGKSESIDFTVVEDSQIPEELKKLIDEKKSNTMRMTYATKEYTYIAVGYGTVETSGYSIRVNDVYMGKDSVVVDVDLIGPSEGEQVTELPTMPYIVLKLEKRDDMVVFKM